MYYACVRIVRIAVYTVLIYAAIQLLCFGVNKCRQYIVINNPELIDTSNPDNDEFLQNYCRRYRKAQLTVIKQGIDLYIIFTIDIPVNKICKRYEPTV